MTVGAMTTVSNLFDGGVKAFEGAIKIGVQDTTLENASLITRLPDLSISNVDFSSSTLLLSAQVKNETTTSGGVLVVPISSVNLDDVSFVAFDQERYQVQYSSGAIANIDESQVTVTPTSLTISNLTPSQSNITVNVTVSKANIKNKVKEFKRSQKVSITRSTNRRSGTDPSTSINDGLNHSELYGLRVQDKEICLNYPDVTDKLNNHS